MDLDDAAAVIAVLGALAASSIPPVTEPAPASFWADRATSDLAPGALPPPGRGSWWASGLAR